MTANQIAYIEAMEAGRHNLAAERETHRSNLESESIGRRNASTNEKNARTNAWNTALQNVLSFIF